MLSGVGFGKMAVLSAVVVLAAGVVLSAEVVSAAGVVLAAEVVLADVAVLAVVVVEQQRNLMEQADLTVLDMHYLFAAV